jgi:hypothetical protein
VSNIDQSNFERHDLAHLSNPPMLARREAVGRKSLRALVLTSREKQVRLPFRPPQANPIADRCAKSARD